MAIEELTSLISDQTFGIWFLIGAALVFWMQAGFAWLRLVLPELRTQVTLL